MKCSTRNGSAKIKKTKSSQDKVVVNKACPSKRRKTHLRNMPTAKSIGLITRTCKENAQSSTSTSHKIPFPGSEKKKKAKSSSHTPQHRTKRSSTRSTCSSHTSYMKVLPAPTTSISKKVTRSSNKTFTNFSLHQSEEKIFSLVNGKMEVKVTLEDSLLALAAKRDIRNVQGKRKSVKKSTRRTRHSDTTSNKNKEPAPVVKNGISFVCFSSSRLPHSPKEKYDFTRKRHFSEDVCTSYAQISADRASVTECVSENQQHFHNNVLCNYKSFNNDTRMNYIRHNVKEKLEKNEKSCLKWTRSLRSSQGIYHSALYALGLDLVLRKTRKMKSHTKDNRNKKQNYTSTADIQGLSDSETGCMKNSIHNNLCPSRQIHKNFPEHEGTCADIQSVNYRQKSNLKLESGCSCDFLSSNLIKCPRNRIKSESMQSSFSSSTASSIDHSSKPNSFAEDRNKDEQLVTTTRQSTTSFSKPSDVLDDPCESSSLYNKELPAGPAVCYFESDHIALKHNQDYHALLRASASLQAQRRQALKDLDILQRRLPEALRDPIAFVDKLRRKNGLNLPSARTVAPLPAVDWSTYTSPFSAFESVTTSHNSTKSWFKHRLRHGKSNGSQKRSFVNEHEADHHTSFTRMSTSRFHVPHQTRVDDNDQSSSGDEEDDSNGWQRMNGEQVSDEEDIPTKLRYTNEYLEILQLKRERKKKLQLFDDDGHIAIAKHIGYQCDVCAMEPITGVRFHCIDCPESESVDLCQACVKSRIKFETSTHESNHRIEAVYASLAEKIAFRPSTRMNVDIDYGYCSSFL